MLYRTIFGTPSRRPDSSFADLAVMRRQMDQLFNSFPDRPVGRAGAGVFPSINLTEDGEAYYVSAELPGVTSTDLDLNVTANQLTVAGERKISEAAADVCYHRREREAGRFSRAIALPGDVDADNVKARLVDGVLTVTVPKVEKAKPRQISIH